MRKKIKIIPECEFVQNKLGEEVFTVSALKNAFSKPKRKLKWFFDGLVNVFRCAFGVDRADFYTVHHRNWECAKCGKITSNRCDVCGCVITYKTLAKSQTCPLARWGEIRDSKW
jgi:hypothetical protein